MITLINKKSKKEVTVLDHKVHEGQDSFFIAGENLSLPKDDWKIKGKKK